MDEPYTYAPISHLIPLLFLPWDSEEISLVSIAVGCKVPWQSRQFEKVIKKGDLSAQRVSPPMVTRPDSERERDSGRDPVQEKSGNGRAPVFRKMGAVWTLDERDDKIYRETSFLVTNGPFRPWRLDLSDRSLSANGQQQRGG